MTLTKVVDGKTVYLSPEEEAKILAEWEANAPVKKPPMASPPNNAELAARVKYLEDKLK